jgi:hypothetical protein
MNSRQIESWALRVVDCIKSGQPNEDFLVELKREWILEIKAARRIAGHANAARGENILWLIGVDEKQGVIGADAANLASWYPAVESFFEELAPRMLPLNIPIDGKIIVALLFETDRAPYVVKNPAYGQHKGDLAEFEVPWRESTRIRTARRSDLIRLLSPLELLPEIEIIGGYLTETIEGKDSVGNYIPDELRLNLELYIVPKNKNRIVIPFHRCQVEFEIIGIPTTKFNWLRLDPARGDHYGFGSTGKPGCLTITSTLNEIIIDGPGKLLLEATVRRPALPYGSKNCDVAISVHLLPTDANRAVVLSTTLSYPIEK